MPKRPPTPASPVADRAPPRNLDEARLALALDAASASTWDHDIPGRCVHLDARWGHIIGSNPQAHTLATRRLFALVHPNDRSHAIAQVRACYLGRATQFQVEYRVRHAEGEWIWLLSRGRVVAWDETGCARRMIGINTDITEHKRVEERLRQHVQFLTEIQVATVELLDRPDQATVLQAIALRAAIIFGAHAASIELLENDELVTRVATPGAERRPGQRRRRDEAGPRWRALQTREPVTLVENAGDPPPAAGAPPAATALFPIVAGDAAIGLIGISRGPPGHGFTPDELQMGRLFAQIAAVLLRNAGIYDDAVRLGEARTAALRESEERYRTLIELSGDAVFLLASSGRILTANATAARMHGYTLEELASMHVGDLDTPDSARHVPARIRRVLAGESLTFEVTHRRKDGTLFPIEVTASAVQLNGETYVLAFDRDITKRKAAETALQQARTMESLGTLAGGVAHDFNNLLGGMCGYVEIARERLPAEDPVRLLLGQTLDLGRHARDLVRQILTFSRRTIGEYKPLDLSATVAEGLALTHFSLPPGAELQTQLDPACPPIAADATQIHQIVLNLCTNASHALPATGGRIVVSVSPADAPARLVANHPALAGRPVVCLSVADNGGGMDAVTLDRIFEPFFTTKESGKGTGLGLAVVHGIVGAHGGAIEATSEPGRGTTFDVYFPTLPPAAPLPPEEEPPAGHQENILWVDDNPATGEVIAHLLRSFGYEVTHVASAPEALAQFTATPDAFATLITDLAMPDLDGEQLARAVLRLRPDLPVLLLTGMVEPSREAALQEAGIREIVFKPTTGIELARAVNRHLAPRRRPAT